MTQNLLASAINAYYAERFDECIVTCQEGLQLTPADETLSTLLGMALQAQGNYPQAAAIFALLCEMHPDKSEHHTNLGLMLRHSGDFTAAEIALRKALTLASTSHEALLNYGLLLMDMGRIAEARHTFLDACVASPESAAARIYAALACFECGDARRSESLIPKQDCWSTLDLDLRHDLAMALIQLGRAGEAETLLVHSAEVLAEPTAIARLATLHERTNRLESANKLLERIRPQIEQGSRDLQIDALTVQAALALRSNRLDEARDSVERLLQLNLPAPARANAWFTRAQIADKEEAVPTAMAALAEAHSLQLALAAAIVPEMASSEDEPLRIAARWMSSAQCQFPEDGNEPTVESSPVFIVGYPRSGTTMLEQMLDAHPDFVSMDERAILQRCVEHVERCGLTYPDDLSRLSPQQVEDLRSIYWSEVSKVVTVAKKQRLVDKNPLNMLRLPMIIRLFPNARIILALRHPCDVVLSNYMQNFRSPAFMVLCSSLERLARSYVSSMRFWLHHEALLAPHVLHLRYEETVTDFPTQVKKIANYLNMEDSHHLGDFAAHAVKKGYISTPSYAQVTEGVNTRSISRWHRYRTYFESVLPILEPIAVHWGYNLRQP